MKDSKTIGIALPDIFQNGMIIQREKPVRIRGEAADDIETVLVTLSDPCGQDECCKATVRGGRFACELAARPAGTGCRLTFTACRKYSSGIQEEPHATIRLEDVSFGDVWLACGQSNMEYFLRYDAHWNDIKKEPCNPYIHMSGK